MKTLILTLILTVGLSAIAVDVVAPPATEDQKKAEQQAETQVQAKKMTFEQKREALKKKHAKKKADRLVAIEEAKKKIKSNAVSTDSTQATTVQEVINQKRTEEKREDKTSN